MCKPVVNEKDVYINSQLSEFMDQNSISEIESSVKILRKMQQGELDMQYMHPLPISVFAQHLGVLVDECYAEPLSYIADLALNVLPPGWEMELVDSEYGKMPFFYNAADNSSYWTHPFEL